MKLKLQLFLLVMATSLLSTIEASAQTSYFIDFGDAAVQTGYTSITDALVYDVTAGY